MPPNNVHIFEKANQRTPQGPLDRTIQELRNDFEEFDLPDDDLNLAEKPLEPEPVRGNGFFGEGEGAEDPDDDPEFEPDDITTPAHAELENIRELRQFSRNIIWDMPLLWSESQGLSEYIESEYSH